MQKIVIVDYGMGNLHSVQKAVKKVSTTKDFIEISSDAKSLELADTLIFPGVGAAGAAMAKLAEYNLIASLKQGLANKKFLGICLGMQVLFEKSAEFANGETLGHFSGEIVKFDYAGLNASADSGQKLKVPHMGWNSTELWHKHELWDISSEDFYFVHSYYAPLPLKEQMDSALITEYGDEKFLSAFVKNNVAATQFHPEKSATAGLEFLENFLTWQPEIKN